jgi:hypothetical protein
MIEVSGLRAPYHLSKGPRGVLNGGRKLTEEATLGLRVLGDDYETVSREMLVWTPGSIFRGGSAAGRAESTMTASESCEQLHTQKLGKGNPKGTSLDVEMQSEDPPGERSAHEVNWLLSKPFQPGWHKVAQGNATQGIQDSKDLTIQQRYAVAPNASLVSSVSGVVVVLFRFRIKRGSSKSTKPSDKIGEGHKHENMNTSGGPYCVLSRVLAKWSQKKSGLVLLGEDRMMIGPKGESDRLDFLQNPLPTFLRSLSEVLEFDRRFALVWGVSQSTSSDAVSVRMLELPVTQFGRTEWLCFRAVLKEEFGGITIR